MERFTEIELDTILNNAYSDPDPAATITYTLQHLQSPGDPFDLARRSYERLRDYLMTDDELDAKEVLAMATTMHAIDTYIVDESR